MSDYDDLLKNSSNNEQKQNSDNGTSGNSTSQKEKNSAESVLKATYTSDELRDINNITVTIPDAKTPIVVFFGSPASGKTLALLRMVRFLEQHEHQVVPDVLKLIDII